MPLARHLDTNEELCLTGRHITGPSTSTRMGVALPSSPRSHHMHGPSHPPQIDQPRQLHSLSRNTSHREGCCVKKSPSNEGKRRSDPIANPCSPDFPGADESGRSGGVRWSRQIKPSTFCMPRDVRIRLMRFLYSTWDVIVAPRCLPRQPWRERGHNVGQASPRAGL